MLMTKLLMTFLSSHFFFKKSVLKGHFQFEDIWRSPNIRNYFCFLCSKKEKKWFLVHTKIKKWGIFSQLQYFDVAQAVGKNFWWYKKYFPFRKHAKSISRFCVQGKFFLFAEEMKYFINVGSLISGEASVCLTSANLARPIWGSSVHLVSQTLIKCFLTYLLST